MPNNKISKLDQVMLRGGVKTLGLDKFSAVADASRQAELLSGNKLPGCRKSRTDMKESGHIETLVDKNRLEVATPGSSKRDPGRATPKADKKDAR